MLLLILHLRTGVGRGRLRILNLGWFGGMRRTAGQSAVNRIPKRGSLQFI